MELQNILQEQGTVIEPTGYSRLYTALKFEKAWKCIQAGIKTFRFFSIARNTVNDKEYVQLIPKTDTASFAYAVQTLSKTLSNSYLQPLQKWLKPMSFKSTDKKGILSYIYLDVLCAFEYYSKVREDNELIDYICLETKSSKNSSIFGKPKNNIVRSNIHTLNKDSFFFDSVTGSIRFQKRIPASALNNIKANPLLSFIEICNGVDAAKLEKFSANCLKHCLQLVEKEGLCVPNDAKFSLKIRKIKRTNKKAMYIKATNSIVLDPRHVDSFRHELGHWYHTWFRPDIVTAQQAEEFAEVF